MSRLVWLVLGLIGGVAISRNAAAMPAPVAGAVILAAVVGCGITWWAAYRGKSQAVATAVAIAQAEAVAIADARAAAIAQAAVHLHMNGGSAALEGQLVDEVHDLDRAGFLDHAATAQLVAAGGPRQRSAGSGRHELAPAPDWARAMADPDEAIRTDY